MPQCASKLAIASVALSAVASLPQVFLQCARWNVFHILHLDGVVGLCLRMHMMVGSAEVLLAWFQVGGVL